MAAEESGDGHDLARRGASPLPKLPAARPSHPPALHAARTSPSPNIEAVGPNPSPSSHAVSHCSAPGRDPETMAGGGSKEEGPALAPPQNKASASAKERGEALAFACGRATPLESVIDSTSKRQRTVKAVQLDEAASGSSSLAIDMYTTGETAEERRWLRKEEEALNAGSLQVPSRPAWRTEMSVKEIDAGERQAFLTWRKNLASLDEKEKLRLTPFYEDNIDTWRQLWRVLERSELLVMVVDARDPLIYSCPDLEVYAKEIDEHKRTMLLVNKADLLPLNIRKKWAEYFKAHDILHVFWSAKAATATLEGKKLSGYSEEESASLDLDTKIYGRDELLMRLQAEAESIVAQRRTSTSEEDRDLSSSDSVSSMAKHVVVGFVGYPNVGKSSTINALVGEKRMSVTDTADSARQVKTILISDVLSLCDRPGVFLPCFSSSRHESFTEDVTSIEQLAIHNLRNKVQEALVSTQGNRENRIKKLQILADDIRIWLNFGNTSIVQVLIGPYINIGKEVMRLTSASGYTIEEDRETSIKLLKEMIHDLEYINDQLESAIGTFRNENGVKAMAFQRHTLRMTIAKNETTIELLETIMKLMKGWNGDSLVKKICRLDEEINSYTEYVLFTLRKAEVPNTAPISFLSLARETKTRYFIDNILKDLMALPFTAETEEMKICSPSEKQFRRIVSSMRGKSRRPRTVINPKFKGHKMMIADDPLRSRCFCCFEEEANYFTTCCDVVLCRSCMEKKRGGLLCEQAHVLRVNLNFPLVFQVSKYYPAG